MVNGSISAMGYVSLQTRDLGASITNAVDILGLREVSSTGSKAFLSATATSHELVYTSGDADRVNHFGLVAPNREELAAIRAKVERGGWRILSEQPIEDGIEEGFAFVGPEGFAWHIYLPLAQLDYRSGNFGPDRYGHINIKARNTLAMRDFLIETFDFLVSDQIGTDQGFFMRCNPEHHGIAIIKADAAGLHHHAWQSQNIADLGRLGDRLARAGRRLMWGPLRHGAGHNIAAYFLEPAGGVIELYTDMEYIYDRGRDAIVWGADDLWWLNQWDGYVPEAMRTPIIPPIER